jgi:hypothetical protein
MAAAAIIIFILLVFILSRAWSQLGEGPIRWLFLAGAIATPVAAWSFLKVVMSGVSPFPVHRKAGPIGELLWAAALGDAAASANLQAIRERLRTELTTAPPPDPARCANIRGAYSITLESADRILAELQPTTVVLRSGTSGDKDTILRRLEGEITMWQSDYAWFEHFIDRSTA